MRDLLSITQTQRRPVVVARLFLFSLFFLLARTAFSSGAGGLGAPSEAPFEFAEQGQSFLARIGYNDPKEINEALIRVEDLYSQDKAVDLSSPIAIVVHGPEVSVFKRENYGDYKEIIDRAARLTALGILDIRVCELRLKRSGADVDTIYPFVGTVDFGPTEVDRLLSEDGYVYF